MNYKKVMGYDEKKKTPKPKKNRVLEGIKSDLNEWNDTTFKNAPKRWSTDKGLTEYEEQLKEVGAGAEYRKYYKNIEKTENQQAKQVNNLVQLLMKKGLKKEATAIASKYVKGVAEFDNFLKKLIGKMM